MNTIKKHPITFTSLLTLLLLVVSVWITTILVSPANASTTNAYDAVTYRIPFNGETSTSYPNNVNLVNFQSESYQGVTIDAGCNINGKIFDTYLDSWIDIPAADDDIISVDAAIGNGARTLATQPTHPRNLQITITDANASITAYTLVILGVGADGQLLTETFTFTSGLALVTNHAYATITSATFSALAGNEGGDNVKIGTSNLFGLSGKCNYTSSGYKFTVDGANTAIPTISTTYSTIDLSGSAPDASKDFNIWYKTVR